MFFSLSKLVGPLASPLPILLLLAVGVLLWRRHPSRRLLLGLLVALWVASAPLLVNGLLRWWEGGFPARPLVELPEADAAVVLGGVLHGRPPHGLPERLEWTGAVDRLLEAERLLAAGRVGSLILAGGTADLRGRVPAEAPRLAAWLVEERGHDPARILVDAGSRNTWENARASVRLARERGLERLVVVTSALHMRRAIGAFRAAGVEPVPWPVDFRSEARALGLRDFLPSEAALLDMRQLCREWIGLAAYALTGRVAGRVEPGVEGRQEADPRRVGRRAASPREVLPRGRRAKRGPPRS